MPRITQEQKKLNREKIVRAAGEGFRLHGIDGIGIEELMKTAGMTHGGFYNHFSSKEDLALEVYRRGFADSLGVLGAIRTSHPRSARAAWHGLVDEYVTADHRDHPETGCASAALAVDAGRHGAASQTEYRRGLEGYFSAITEMVLDRARQAGTALTAAEGREQAVALFSQMVGALVVSRAVAEADPGLSDEVLTANRRQLKQR
ncbi:TetR/AcrR family transcriptional regulator [Amycolatopsis jiangsuensis]|uniref:TetR/AcrR family transcriptional repressor of nem operon n=1 Tax=Amycolatopsis jiangsuensis TaxID=1181879 RepID=A0A840J7E6_9PSEU|nr:TetR/AcrR family transcriptional regulator [Amycolatopsis jiangsuensis]MBB4689525.1 TetR/AcrR family transcriptional repressor of nem operon [Amycolatopsis jiangsuensis]